MKAICDKLSPWLRSSLLAVTLLGVGSSLAFDRLAEKWHGRPAEVRLVVDETPVSRDSRAVTSFAPVVKRVAPAVVKVVTTAKVVPVSQKNLPFGSEELWRRFFGQDLEGNGKPFSHPQHGMGSGVVVSKDGYILTNNHVVDGADEVKVTLGSESTEYTAKVIGKDPKTDVAVLKIDADNLPFAALGNSDHIEVGDLVLAIGNPFGIGQTVTMGMVSATGRANVGLDYEDFIQTDAAINPGNSGGALVDAEGRLIGINTAILSRSGGNQGIGFAVPINLGRSVMESLVKEGRVVRGYLGITIQDLTPALAREFGDVRGALVADVNPQSPAEAAGIKSGDIITQFNGKPVSDSRQLKLQVAQAAPGSKKPVTLLRNGKEMTLQVALKELPGSDKAPKGRDLPTSTDEALAGVEVGDLTPETRKELNVPANVKGALVTGVEPGSAAAEAGLRQGDVIQEINRQSVGSAQDAVRLTEKPKSKRTLLRVWTRSGSRYLVVDESKAS